MKINLDIYGYKLDIKQLDEEGNEIPPTKKLQIKMDGDNAIIMNIQSYLNQTFDVR